MNTNLKNEREFAKGIWVQIPCLPLCQAGAGLLPLRKSDNGRRAEACRHHNLEQKGRAPAFRRGSAPANSRGHTFLVLPLLSFSSRSPCLGSDSSPDGACTWTLAWANFPVRSQGPWREPYLAPTQLDSRPAAQAPFFTCACILAAFPDPARGWPGVPISACPGGPPSLAAAPPRP